MNADIVSIRISSYDVAMHSSLTNEEMSALFVAAVRARYPSADISVYGGQMTPVVAIDADGLQIDNSVIDSLRELLGRVWKQATIDHPHWSRWARDDGQ